MKKLLLFGGVILLAAVLVIVVMTLTEPEAEPLRVYMYRDSEEEVFKPSIVLFDDGTFSMSFSAYSSYAGYGTYTLSEETLVLNTNDGNYTYTFKVQKDGFAFDAANSSANTHYAKIPDGALFY